MYVQRRLVPRFTPSRELTDDYALCFALGPICGSVSRAAGWVRLFGRGFKWRHAEKVMPLFSERMGYAKTRRLGPYVFASLTNR